MHAIDKMLDHELPSLIRLRFISIEQLTIFNQIKYSLLVFYLKLQMIPNDDALDHEQMP